MKILLDTHVWLWWAVTPEKLPAATLSVLKNPDNVVYFSAASAWEITIKSALGKLTLPAAPATFIPRQLVLDNMLSLPVTVAHALRVYELPPHHHDPFDRLLIAQAQVEKLPLLTFDSQLDAYVFPRPLFPRD